MRGVRQGCRKPFGPTKLSPASRVFASRYIDGMLGCTLSRMWNGVQKMPNLGTVLKAEISRLARKEVRAEVEALRKASSTYRREIAELKRQVVQLERKLRHTAKSTPVSVASDEAPSRFRFSAKGLRSLRTKLGLSAADFGKLAGVSGQSIYHWEQGKSVPRKSQLPKLAGLRGLGKREALQRLGVE